MQDDKELVSRCCKGERAAQKELYERFAAGMLAVCMRYTKARDDAEDILQEAFIKVFNNIDKFRHESSLGFWIKRIVINTALNYHRKQVYLYPHVDVDERHDLGNEDVAIENYHFKDLLNLLQSLPKGCQIVFNLYAIEGYKHKEIAEMLDISEGTSKSQYARAKSLLKDMISELGEVKHG